MREKYSRLTSSRQFLENIEIPTSCLRQQRWTFGCLREKGESVDQEPEPVLSPKLAYIEESSLLASVHCDPSLKLATLQAPLAHEELFLPFRIKSIIISVIVRSKKRK